MYEAVDCLHSRLEEEAQQWRQQQMGASRAGGLMEVGVEWVGGRE